MTRVWGLVLALVVTGAPLAPVVCGLTCASHDVRGTAPRSEHHSCHESSSEGAIAVPLPHACGHENDGSIAPQELIQILVSPGLIEAPVVAIASPDSPMDIGGSIRIGHRPPALPTLTTPLRV